MLIKRKHITRNITRFLAISVMISSAGVFNVEVLADKEEIKPIEVSTLNTELKAKTQVHYKGTPEQLASVEKNTLTFIKQIAKAAHESGYDYGLYPSVTIAQAVLESSGGTSGLSKSPNNNLFGIKGSYEAKSVKMKTNEHTSTGEVYSIDANFKVYPDWETSLRDHDKLLRYGVNGLYSGAWRENAKTPEHAANALQGKYASDNNYAAKLMQIIKTYNLERFDRNMTKRDLMWLQSDSLDPWELPIVEDEIAIKSNTWASNYKDKQLDFVNKIKSLTKMTSDGLTSEDVDKYYVEKTLGLKHKLKEISVDRYKREPKVGDIAIYKSETGDNKIIENYAIIKGFEDNSMLISEGIKGEHGIHEIYRMIPEDSLEKYEFINIDDLNLSKEKLNKMKVELIK